MFDFLKKSNKVEGKLTYYGESFGGNMQGGFHSKYVRSLGNGRAVIELTDKQWHFMEEEIEEYEVSDEIFAKIQEAFEEGGICGCKKWPKSEIFALDAGTTSYRFEFDTREAFGFNSDMQVPRESYDALRKIRELIQAAISEETRLPRLVMEPVTNPQNPYQEAVEGQVRLVPCKYCGKNLSFRVINGLAEQISVTGTVEVIRVSENAEEVICSEELPYPLSADPSRYNEKQITLSERLKAGNYKLRVNGYEAPFEIR